jgi:predicted  nucleic acid-binding Zn-ribbon protein
MNMEGIINDLKDVNEKLTKEVEQNRGNQLSSEQEIAAAKKQVEDEFKAKLCYKETELADLTTKLGRISQSNIDLKTRCERLEAGNAELSSDLE